VSTDPPDGPAAAASSSLDGSDPAEPVLPTPDGCACFILAHLEMSAGRGQSVLADVGQGNGEAVSASRRPAEVAARDDDGERIRHEGL